MRRLLGALAAPLTAVALTAAILLTGCSSTATMSRSEAEKQISASLEKQVGQKPDSVTCPDDIEAVKGKTMKCELEADGQTYGLTMTITSVDGDNAKFDIKVDDAPKG